LILPFAVLFLAQRQSIVVCKLHHKKEKENEGCSSLGLLVMVRVPRSKEHARGNSSMPTQVSLSLSLTFP